MRSFLRSRESIHPGSHKKRRGKAPREGGMAPLEYSIICKNPILQPAEDLLGPSCFIVANRELLYSIWRHKSAINQMFACLLLLVLVAFLHLPIDRTSGTPSLCCREGKLVGPSAIWRCSGSGMHASSEPSVSEGIFKTSSK